MPTLDWLHRDAAFRIAERVPKEIQKGQVGRLWAQRSGGRALFAVVFKENRGLNVSQQLDAALSRP